MKLSRLKVMIVYRNILAGLYILLLVGCGPHLDPVKRPVTSDELVGTWKLSNSPGAAPGGPSLPSSTGSYFILQRTNIEFHGVLVEKAISKQGSPPNVQWQVISTSVPWEIFEHSTDDGWQPVVRVDFHDQTIMELAVKQDRNGHFVLSYWPDPEMAEPFIFVRKSATN